MCAAQRVDWTLGVAQCDSVENGAMLSCEGNVVPMELSILLLSPEKGGVPQGSGRVYVGDCCIGCWDFC